MLKLLIATISLLNASQDPAQNADKMLVLATADQPIVTTGIVPAPIKDVWRAWTESSEITKWMVPTGEVEFRIGGKYRTSYNKDSDLTGPDVIENTILAYDPMRMITIQNTKAPANFPFKKMIAQVWTVIYLKEVDKDTTEVVVRMNGFDHSEESLKMKPFFVQGNQATLDALIRRFKLKS